jgi:hypothetical protein
MRDDVGWQEGRLRPQRLSVLLAALACCRGGAYCTFLEENAGVGTKCCGRYERSVDGRNGTLVARAKLNAIERFRLSFHPISNYVVIRRKSNDCPSFLSATDCSFRH